MGTIKLNNEVYGTSYSSEIMYKDITVEEKLDTVPIFDIEYNINNDNNVNNYLTYDNIIDNLTSVNIDKALSANQGKILKEEIDNLNAEYLTDKTTINKDID